ncbi:MAG: adenylyltransferase/cytidyltransferase family protein [Candidatus Aenigmatarchaeota archaeon]
MNEKIVAVSGGFDPVHIGHLELLRDAKSLGDKLVVILNNDNWLKNKKGYAFMDEEEKKEILGEFECVDEVFITEHGERVEDPSVCEALRKIKPDVFANGGDRKKHNVPEYDLCEELGIDMTFNVGGEKKQSSSKLVENARKRGMSK